MHHHRAMASLIIMTAVGTAGPAVGDVVFIGAMKDNTLYQSDAGARSNGLGQNMVVGTNSNTNIRRALIAFDIAGNIPAGATILSVALTLHAEQAPNGERTIDLHRVLNDWGEGTSDAGERGGSGADSTPGDATWLHTFYDSDLWANAGGDFDPAVSASQTVDSMGFYTWDSTSALVADVQFWLDNPGMSYGWMLRNDESQASTGKLLDTHEHPDESRRPSLRVEYIPAPSAALVLLGAFGSRRRRPM